MADSFSPRRTTLSDIARRVGVSSATVSLALRNDPQISQSRRDEIARVAAEAGYRPDPMLSALNRYRYRADAPVSCALAWINRWRRPAALRELHEFDEYWLGAAAMAESHGYHLEEIVWGEQISGGRLRDILNARGIRGVFVPPAERNNECKISLAWDDFPWNSFAAVRLGRSVATPSFPVVATDQVYNCRLAFDEICGKGYMRVGFVTSERMVAFTLSLAGFLRAQFAMPIRRRLHPLVLDANDTVRAGKSFRYWLQRTRPQAILTDEPLVRTWLTELGLCVPQDVAVVALSVLDGAAAVGIDQRSREIGRTAVEVLITLLDRNIQDVPEVGREILIQGRWVDSGALPIRT